VFDNPTDNVQEGSRVNAAVAYGLLRHFIALGSIWLVSKGYVTQPTLDLALYGLAAAMIVWSVVQKYGVNALIETALRMKPGSTFADLHAVRGGEVPPSSQAGR